MTIKNLIDYSNEAGLEILSIVTFPKEQYLRMMTNDILKLAKKNYPTCELNDLISNRIIVIHRKKNK